MRIKIVKNTQTGSDSIESLVGQEFDVYEKFKETWQDGIVDILHDGHVLEVAPEEYEVI